MTSPRKHRLLPVTALLLISTLLTSGLAGETDSSRWESAIRAFEVKDRESPPPEDPILFIGSSSIRMWKLEKHFPDAPVMNRGFGGSQIADSLAYASRIIIPYEPEVMVLYAGDNDIAAGKSPETVCSDFRKLVSTVLDALPGTRIVFVAIKPSIRRWGLVEKMRAANALIRSVTESNGLLSYVDIDAPMIGADGKPRAALFLGDGLHLNEEGYALWSYLVRPYIGLAEEGNSGRLLAATCQFPVSSDPRANGEWIRKQMRLASSKGADIAHFPEAALSGYAGVDHGSLEEFPWDVQRDELESILGLARELEQWVVLGAAHRLSGDNKPHNSLYVIHPEGKIVERYDKRFCTSGDLRYYSPGDHFSVFEVNGVKCGLLICYDIRFPEVFRQYHLREVELIFHSFYNARQKEGAIHPKIMPPTAQARAATNYVFLSVNNSCAPRSWESLFVTPDGLIHQKLLLDEPGVMVNLVDTRRKYYDASRPYRKDAIEGKLHSGDTVEDPRSRDRTAY